MWSGYKELAIGYDLLIQILQGASQQEVLNAEGLLPALKITHGWQDVIISLGLRVPGSMSSSDFRRSQRKLDKYIEGLMANIMRRVSAETELPSRNELMCLCRDVQAKARPEDRA